MLAPGEEGGGLRGAARWRAAPRSGAVEGMLHAEWDWDGTALRARVDRYGFFNLYCYEKDGVVALSPSLLQLVAQGCDARPDARALAVFHRLGIFVGDETPLAHVRTLPPGGRLHWSPADGLTVTAGEPAPKARSISREGAVEGMITLFRAAMERALAVADGPLRLPLSGGRDSRHILLEMLHQGRTPEACVTFHHGGAAMNAEARAARALCARLGVRHDVLGHPRPRIADSLRAAVLTSLCADEHAQMMPLHDYFLDRRGMTFDGLAGDILTNPDNDAERFMNLAEAGDYKGIARGMIEGHGRVISGPGWGRGAGPILSPGRDEEVRDHVARAIERYSSAPDPYQMFWFLHRTRREINFVPQAILSGADAVFCPYLDPDFVEFCISLPYSVTRDQQLHNDAIARAYPQVADLPYQEGYSNPVARRGPVMQKLRNARDAMRVVARLRPAAPMGRVSEFLRPPGRLARGAGDVYRLHALCMEDLDAAKARRLLGLAAEFEAARPARLVTDRGP